MINEIFMISGMFMVSGMFIYGHGHNIYINCCATLHNRCELSRPRLKTPYIQRKPLFIPDFATAIFSLVSLLSSRDSPCRIYLQGDR